MDHTLWVFNLPRLRPEIGKADHPQPCGGGRPSVTLPRTATSTTSRLATKRLAPGPIYPNERAVKRSHPIGGTGGALKADHFFAVGLSKRVHLEYDADHEDFEARHGVTHAELVKRQWAALEVSPGPWMFVGMTPKRAAWLRRVLSRMGVNYQTA